jgi:hypothetical protein
MLKQVVDLPTVQQRRVIKFLAVFKTANRLGTKIERKLGMKDLCLRESNFTWLTPIQSNNLPKRVASADQAALHR